MTGLEAALAIGGSLLSAVGSVAGGISADNQAEAQAQAAERQAGEAQAVSQREAIQRSKEAKLLLSRNQALAAASGGGLLLPALIPISSAALPAQAVQAASTSATQRVAGGRWWLCSRRPGSPTK